MKKTIFSSLQWLRSSRAASQWRPQAHQQPQPGERHALRADDRPRQHAHADVRHPDDRDHRGRYTGTSVSTTADLAGPVELRVHSVYNTTTKLGTVNGTLRIGAADDRSKAAFTAINSDGKLDGWLRGSAGHRDGTIFGSLSGSFSKTGGLTDGQLGTGTGANTAVLAKRAECKKAESTRPSVHLLVRGEVDAVSATSISVKPKDGSATQTCTVKSGRRQGIEKGDKVEMTCVQVAGVWTLAKVHERR